MITLVSSLLPADDAPGNLPVKRAPEEDEDAAISALLGAVETYLARPSPRPLPQPATEFQEDFALLQTALSASAGPSMAKTTIQS